MTQGEAFNLAQLPLPKGEEVLKREPKSDKRGQESAMPEVRK